jgi:hypothetical protein
MLRDILFHEETVGTAVNIQWTAACAFLEHASSKPE